MKIQYTLINPESGRMGLPEFGDGPHEARYDSLQEAAAQAEILNRKRERPYTGLLVVTVLDLTKDADT